MKERRRVTAAVLIGAAILLHGYVASRRSARLLEHDESISLLAAAGKSLRADALYTDQIQALPAEDVQNLMRLTGETGLRDVVQSLAERDKHPPLYFVILHGIQRLGIESHVMLRLLGTLLIFVAAWVAWRWIWPDAPFVSKLLGTSLMIVSPVLVEVATELRQYSLVYLGTVISIAGLIRYWEAQRPARGTIILMSLGPALLLWTQFGTAVWVVVVFAVALARLVRAPPVCWKALRWSVLIAGVLILPLVWWGSHTFVAAAKSRGPFLSLDGIVECGGAVLSGASGAWCSLPGRWEAIEMGPLIAGMTFVLISVLVSVRRAVTDRVLLYTAVAWTLVWVLWLAGGKIPLHAVLAKHLAPLVLCPLVLLVRATCTRNPVWVQRIAMVVMAAGLLTHVGIGTAQLAARLGTQPSVAALRSANCLLVDSPKRGYVLPLVEKMQPGARVIIARPPAVADRWAELTKLLPDSGLVLAEVNANPGDRREPALQRVVDRLSWTYRDVATLRKGPRRTITEFREKLSAVSFQPSAGDTSR